MKNSSNSNNLNNAITNKLIIGLTGGIGSGKTAVSDWFNTQNIDVVDADVIAHSIVTKGSPTLQNLVDTLGDWVVKDDGNMDRAAVRDYVFNNNEALLTLESITHPAIRQEIMRQLKEAASSYIILSAPLLLESADAGLASLCDRVLVVDVTEQTQLVRASMRDDRPTDKIKAIMQNQLSREDRLAYADDVVNNDGSLQDLYEQLQPLHKKYLTLFNARLGSTRPR